MTNREALVTTLMGLTAALLSVGMLALCVAVPLASFPIMVGGMLATCSGCALLSILEFGFGGI